MDTNEVVLFENDDVFIREQDWETPNTYDNNFQPVPEKSGVYLLVHWPLDGRSKEILYVGCAKNLKQRYEKHEVLRTLCNVFDYIRFYFKETEDYIKNEKFLIQAIRPKFNTQYNK